MFSRWSELLVIWRREVWCSRGTRNTPDERTRRHFLTFADPLLLPQRTAGFPTTSTIVTVNRQCSSGLTAINHIALQIAAGQIDIGIGAGVESMTFGYGAGVMPENVSNSALNLFTNHAWLN